MERIALSWLVQLLDPLCGASSAPVLVREMPDGDGVEAPEAQEAAEAPEVPEAPEAVEPENGKKKKKEKKEKKAEVVKDEKMGQVKVEDLDWIWIGGAEDARDREALERANIRQQLVERINFCKQQEHGRVGNFCENIQHPARFQQVQEQKADPCSRFTNALKDHLRQCENRTCPMAHLHQQPVLIREWRELVLSRIIRKSTQVHRCMLWVTDRKSVVHCCSVG
eukprot:s351_g25.t1